MNKKQIAKELVVGAAETVREIGAGFVSQVFDVDIPIERPAEIKKDFDEDLRRFSVATGRDYELAEGDIEGRYLGKVELAGKTYGMVQQHEKNIVGLVFWSEDLTGCVNKEIKITGQDTRTVERVEDRERGLMREL